MRRLAIESWGPIGKIIDVIPDHGVLNISGLIIACVVAILTYTFQFHNLMSDVFGIRRRFDRKHILVPLARLVGVTIDANKYDVIAKNRKSLMRAVFYKYASSKGENPSLTNTILNTR